MSYEMSNKPNQVKVENTPNPVYGPMGRKVTPCGSDSWEMQHRQAEIPSELINVEIPVTFDLIPIQKMDDLAQ